MNSDRRRERNRRLRRNTQLLQHAADVLEERALLSAGPITAAAASAASASGSGSSTSAAQSNATQSQPAISGVVRLQLFGGGIAGIGLPGLTVELENTSGEVLATTTTGRNGSYTFTQITPPVVIVDVASASGAATAQTSTTEPIPPGSYEVVVELPSFLQEVAPSPGLITLTSSNPSYTSANFEVGLNFTGDSPQTIEADLLELLAALTGQGTLPPNIGGSSSGGGGSSSGGSGGSGSGGGGGGIVDVIDQSTASPSTASSAALDAGSIASQPLDAAFQQYSQVADGLK